MGSSSSSSSFASRLKSLDAHSSVSNEFRVRTGYGAVISTFTVVLIAYLVRSEYRYNFAVETVSSVRVNATSPVGLQMEIDVTIPKIPCAMLSVEAEDPTGQPQSLHIDRTHRVWKHRLDANGDRVGRRSRFEFGNTVREDSHLNSVWEDLEKQKEMRDPEEGGDDEVRDEEECGSCYGAAPDDECCNTCDDVKRAYKLKGWHVADLDAIRQCRHSKTSKEEQGEGCNIHGHVQLGSGGGNFHIVPSKELENFGKDKQMSIIDFFNEAFETYDVSHTINKLRFGRGFPGAVYQLDGESRNVEDSYGMYQYYLQVVPAKFTALKQDPIRPYKTNIETFQFSVMEHLRHVGPRMGRGLPGIYFFYEVSPLHVEVTETHRGWTHFLTSICAIIGGVFSTGSMLDRFVDRTTRSTRPGLIS